MNTGKPLALAANQTPARAVPSGLAFPVVGIGASAGGLPALLRLFGAMPAQHGMAFVVILHLAPEHDSAAGAILQRVTQMPVHQVSERQPIQPGQVYVIAPNQQLSMDDGHLDVTALERPRGKHTAIDLFFRTLAEAHERCAVAVVLSGTGSDGAVGLGRVKELGGVTLAQDPADCDHEGMPVAAIATGVVDFVLPAHEMAAKLVDLWKTSRDMQLPLVAVESEQEPVRGAAIGDSANGRDEEALQRVITMLCADTGHDFRHYKRATVLRRIERRLLVKGVTTLSDYAELLEREPIEFQLLLKDLLISVTAFFRDREAFEVLERTVVPDLFRNKPSGQQIRVWVAACATGQEAYSIAMMLAEHAATLPKPAELQVFASDIDEHAISVARAGTYPTAIAMDVPAIKLRQFFTKEEGRYCIRKSVRDRILFASHNLLRDPPFSRLDMISCRNVLIYLNREAQLRVLEKFHAALNPDGFLFLGSSESADAASEYFVPFDKKNRIYRARTLSRTARYLPTLASPVPHRTPEPLLAGVAPRPQFSFGEVHQRALSKFAPPSLIVDRDSDIVHMSDTAGRFLRHIGGEPSRNVMALVLPELRLELRMALYQALQSGNSVEAHRVMIKRESATFFVNMIVRPFTDEVANTGFVLILFEEIERTMNPQPGESVVEPKDLVLNQLEAELQRSKHKLQETIEHAEVSNEEHRASNEELQAINEELRSATEELETSKEELQSVNEELVTVNYELKVKVEETGKANDDLNNLIASTDIATIFVDRAVCIKRFTPRAADIFSIIATDIGRSLLDITHRLEYGQLADDVASTFDTLHPVERELRSNDGRYYLMRLLPYRTTEDKIEGAVMTFIDISRRREAEAKARIGEEWMRLVADSSDDYAIITTDRQGLVTAWNKGAERNFGYSEQDMLGASLDRLYLPEDRVAGVPDSERRGVRANGRAEDERWYLRKDGSRFFCAGVTTILHKGDFEGYAKIMRDQTSRVHHDEQREVALSREQTGRSHAESANALKDQFLAVMSHELRHPLNIIYINAELLGRLPAVRESAPALRSAAIIRESVTAQAKIIEDLMDVSRVATGKLTLAIQEVDLATVAGKLVDAMRTDPAVDNLQLEFVPYTQPVMVAVDPVRIEQVILNLLSNAVKFTPAGGTVRVVLGVEHDQARLEVSDTGAGISEEALPRVFDMFGQGTATVVRNKTGLGIGLALVRQITELHGGKVEVRSPGIGQGSTFTLCLPLSQTAQAVGEDASGAGLPSIAGRRLLLVDDSEDTASVFQMLLELEGAEVRVASTARQGLDLLGQGTFDAVISDISMPDMDGYEFIAAIRKMPGLERLPVIAASGLGQEQGGKRAIDAGFSAWLTKPVSVEVLCETVSALSEARSE
ncbi:CheR family methyltransferase [Massilia sp. HP4]|uniref:CheR family methyltransferase n=1 Tax=Massilia sp. HP4 TaxID=2562316 RepID=UPI0010BFA8D2|nr:CheR family methyltransferase [Massilia sp. HP4]